MSDTFQILAAFGLRSHSPKISQYINPKTINTPKLSHLKIGTNNGVRSSSITNGSKVAFIQACADSEMQGRVWTISGATMNSATPLALLIAGPVADLLGIKFWFIAGGVGSIIIGIILIFFPAVVYIEEQSTMAE